MVLPIFGGCFFGLFVWFFPGCKKMAEIKVGWKDGEHILILVVCFAFSNFFNNFIHLSMIR